MIDWHSCQICYPLEINKTYYSVCWSTQPINSCSEVNPSIVISRHDRLLLWPVDHVDREQSIWSTISWSAQSTLARNNTSRSYRSYRSLLIDTIDMVDTINCWHSSIVKIVINWHGRQAVGRALKNPHRLYYMYILQNHHSDQNRRTLCRDQHVVTSNIIWSTLKTTTSVEHNCWNSWKMLPPTEKMGIE